MSVLENIQCFPIFQLILANCHNVLMLRFLGPKQIGKQKVTIYCIYPYILSKLAKTSVVGFGSLVHM